MMVRILLLFYCSSFLKKKMFFLTLPERQTSAFTCVESLHQFTRNQPSAPGPRTSTYKPCPLPSNRVLASPPHVSYLRPCQPAHPSTWGPLPPSGPAANTSPLIDPPWQSHSPLTLTHCWHLAQSHHPDCEGRS